MYSSSNSTSSSSSSSTAYPFPSSSSSSEMSSPSTNPVYFLLKDIRRDCEQNGKSLREVTAQLSSSLTGSSLAIFEELNARSHLSRLDEFFLATRPQKCIFTVACSSVFLRKDTRCLPAEIGLVNMSLGDGLSGRYSSLLDPSNERINVSDIMDIAQSTSRVHGVPFTGTFTNLPPLETTLRQVYHIIHPTTGPHQGQGWVFVLDHEYSQTYDVLNWFARKSEKLGLSLPWNLRTVPMSLVISYLARRLGLSKEDLMIEHPIRPHSGSSDEGGQVNTELCAYHKTLDNQNCAYGRACYDALTLYEMFKGKF